MNKILIVVDLGHFKAFKVTTSKMESAKVALIESYDSIGGHGKFGDKMSDTAGRFSRAEGLKVNSKGCGEPHNIETENEKRLIRQIAGSINDLIRKERCDSWDLAAPAKINNIIIDNLLPEVKEKLGRSITADLTKTEKSRILSYFE